MTEAIRDVSFRVDKTGFDDFPDLQKLGKKIHKYFPTLETVGIFLDSSAFVNTAWVGLKNAPYLAYGKELGINDLSHAFSARVDYLEVGMIGFASCIHKAVFSGVFTSLSLVTLGRSEHLNYLAKKSWTHLALSGSSFAIGLLGTLTPTGAATATGGVIALGFKTVSDSLDKDAVKGVKKIWKENKKDIGEWAKQFESGQDDEKKLYETRLKPLLDVLNEEIPQAETLGDLFQLGYDNVVRIIKQTT